MNNITPLPQPHNTPALTLEALTVMRDALIAANISPYDLIAVEQILDRTECTLEEAIEEANSLNWGGEAADQCDMLPMWSYL